MLIKIGNGINALLINIVMGMNQVFVQEQK